MAAPEPVERAEPTTTSAVRDPARRIDPPAPDRPEFGQHTLRPSGAAGDRRGEPVPAVASRVAQAVAYGGDDLPTRASARMKIGAPRAFLAVVGVIVLAALGGALWAPPLARPQAADVMLNVIASGAKKLNIAVPDFALVSGPDQHSLSKRLPEVVGKDLTFSALFSVVSGLPAPPANAQVSARDAWSSAAAAGAHAGLHGFLTMKGDRAQVEMRLYDLTSPEYRQIATKKFEMPVNQAWRLAHKVADEVVLQFTGELGVADTKIAYVNSSSGSKEVYMMDYDGAEPVRLTSNQSNNLSPTWSPDLRSIAFTSFMRGYPYLYRLFPFEKRPVQLMAGYLAVHTSAAMGT